MKKYLLLLFFCISLISAKAQVYCTPSYTGYGIDITGAGHFAYATSFTHIAKVQFGDINFTNYQPSWYNTIPPYMDQTGVPTTPTSCVRGFSYPLSIQLGNGANIQTLSVWVDFNGNKTFEATEKILYQTDPANTGTHVINTNVNFPANAALGVIRMRCGTKFGNNAALDPCVNNDPITPGGGNNWSQQFVDFAVNIVAAQPQIFLSSTTTQTIYDDVVKGSRNNQVIGIEVVTNSNGSINPLTVGNINFSAIGTTNPNEITRARLFYTGLKPTFDTSAVVGNAVTNVSSSFSINASQQLLPGKNFFWLSYDISPTAVLENKIDARCNYITVANIQRVPAVVSPFGNRQIGYCISKGTQSFYIYINRVRMHTLSNLSFYNTTGYDNYTYLSDTIVKNSSAVVKDSVYLTIGNGVNSTAYAAWIDFNRDGFFDDVNELVARDTILRGAGNPLLLEKKHVFNIPVNAVCGRTRMRVSTQSAAYPGACTNPTLIGEVEDYSIIIKEDGQPVADFKNTVVCDGDSTAFTDVSYVFGSSTITNWSWDFGDPGSGSSNTSGQQNPKHKFSTSGVFNVKLTVTSSSAGSPTSTITKAVEVENPVAQFSMNNTSINTPIQFSDASTGGTLVQWSWNFGDPSSGFNNTSTLQNPSHVFANAGVYSVQLIVTTSAGCVDTIVKSVVIQLAVPIAGYTSNNFNPYIGAATNLIDISVNSPTSWTWVFTPNSVTFLNGTSASSQNPVVSFNTLGNYSVKLIVCNVSGCDSITKVFSTKNYSKPVAAFSASPLVVRVGQIVSYLDLSTNDPTSWLWDFGDSTTASIQYPQHIYNKADTFTVKLRISNPAGADSTTIVNYIIVTDGFVMCDNTAATSNFKSGVIMDSGGNDVYGDNETCGFLIRPGCSGTIKFKFQKFRMAVNDFVRVYDGVNDTTGIPLFTGNGFTGITVPDTLYANSGSIFIRMQTNLAGTDSGFVAQWIAENNVKPEVTIIADSVGYVNSVMRFTNFTTGSGNTYLWDVNGDGAMDSTTKDASYRFTITGTYNIMLVAKNCVGSDTGYFKLQIVAPTRVPEADFVSNKIVIDLNDEIILTDLSKYGATQWKWEVTQDATASQAGFVFSNGTNDTMMSPSILFYEPGTYTICLTSTNIIGSSIKYCKTAYIFVKDRAILCYPINTSSTRQGKIFDSGDNLGPYSANENCYFTIGIPCVAKVVLTFKSFNFAAGDYLRIYDGTDSITGIPLFNGLGFSGANSPGTLTSYSGSFFIQESTNGSLNAAGFEADWNAISIDSTNTKVTLVAADTGYVNSVHVFRNTSLPRSAYKYDFNNDAVFDTTSREVIFPYTYTSPGTYDAVMYDVNCDDKTATKNVLVLPVTQKPAVNFDATIRNPSTRDTVVLYDLSRNGATSWSWSITPSSYTLVGSSLSQGYVRVVFNTAGAYTIGLTATNSFGSDAVSRTAYINAHSLCIPTFNAGQTTIGIYHVQIGMMSHVSTQVYGYHDYSQTEIAQLEKGSTGNGIIMERLASAIPQTWSIWLDANQDGQFAATERLGQLVNSTANTVTGNLTIPNTALSGFTKIRFAGYFGAGVTDGCSAMTNGEVEDYGVMIIGDRTKPIITVLGNNPDSVEIGYTYVDPGATAFDNVNGDITSKIVKTGTVNTALIGTYTLTYNVTDSSGNVADEKTRTVNVTADKTAPVITLIGTDTIYVEVHFPYTELGATATDLADGNVTTKIIIAGTVDTSTIGSYTITYQVTDNAGNTRIRFRKVIVRDTTKPVITLIGSAIINIDRGSPYNELGATVTDNYDKNMPPPTITGTVLINTLGQYILLYDATDISGNKAVTVQRTVNVNPPFGIHPIGSLNTFEVTPNPGHDLFKLSLDFVAKEHVIIRITDINGKLLQEFSDEVMNKNITLNLGTYAQGVYLLSVTTREGTAVKRLIKE